MKIYTRTGDAGETALFDGTRVRKADPRVDAYGHIDELNAMLGLARARRRRRRARRRLEQLQRDCSRSARGSPTRPRGSPAACDEGRARRRRRRALEAWIDEAEAELPPLRASSCRRRPPPAPRCTWRAPSAAAPSATSSSLGADAVEPDLLAYVNRLSDLLFVLARLANARAGVADVEW